MDSDYSASTTTASGIKPSSEDICVWPDGTWCHAEELEQMLSFMSDDFQRLYIDTVEYNNFCVTEGLI